MMDLASRIPCRPENDVVQREAKRKEFAHQIEHVLHSRVHAADVQIGRNGIGKKALPDRRHGYPPCKTPTAVSHVENYAALASLDYPGIHLSIDEFMPKPGIAVRVDVARPQLFRQQIV